MKYFFISLTLLLSISTSLVYADDLLDRLEVATELLGEHQGAFYVSKVPELRDKMPSWEWDDEIRKASKCVLDGVAEAKGSAVAQAYVAGIEKDAQLEITSLSKFSEQNSLPKELQGDDQTIYNLMQSCRTLEISAVRLKESGLWDAMMDPKIMQRLLAE